MPITSENTRWAYAGNGVTTAFSVAAKFLANADVSAILVNDSTLVETPWVLGTHFTLTGAGDDAGGTLTATTAPASGTTLVVFIDPDGTQDLGLEEVGSVPMEDLQDALDKLTLLVNRLKTQMGRALVQDDGSISTMDWSAPERVAGAAIAFHATENRLTTLTTLANAISVSAYILTLLDDTTAAAARTTLD